MVNVKKRDGSVEEFNLSKIVSGCEKAGATSEQSLCVAQELLTSVKDVSEVSAENLSSKVISELKKVNERASRAYEDYSRFRQGHTYP